MTRDLTKGEPLPLIISYMLPLVAGNLLQQLYNVADTAIVGRFIDLNALAAVGSTHAVIFLVIGFCNGLGMGAMIPVAQWFGAERCSDMRKSAVNGWYLLLGISVLLAALTSVFCREILLLLRTQPELMEYTRQYLLVIFLGIPFTMIYNYGSGLIRAVGDSRTPFAVLLISTALNICLDLFFIITLRLGTSGAALATVLSQGVSGLLCVLWLRFRVPVMRAQPGERRADPALMTRILCVSLPMGLQYSITAVGSLTVQGSVNMLGTAYVAATAAAQKIKTLFMCLVVESGSTAAVYSAQNLGAGELGRIRKGMRKMILLSVILTIFANVCVLFFGRQMLLIFMDASNTEVLGHAMQYMRTVFMCFFPCYVLTILRSAVQGMGHANIAMLSGVVEMISRVLICVALVPRMGYDVICRVDGITWCAAMIFVSFVYLKEISREERKRAVRPRTA